jgi:hypothetical protein
MVTLDTVSVAVAVLLAPPAPLHISEYDVVELTAAVDWVPPAGKVPVQPLDAVQDVALLEVQVSVDVPPGATTEGLTTNVAVGMRLTTALALEVPPEPVQDKEYEVGLATGPVLWLPLNASDPLQPPDAVQEAALLEVHVRVDDAPTATAAGDAFSVTAGWGRRFTEAITGAVMPPGPAHVIEYTVVTVNGPVLWLPLVARVPPQPPDAVHESAFVELHVNVELPPTATATGVAARVTVGTRITVTVAVVCGLTPPGPVQIKE